MCCPCPFPQLVGISLCFDGFYHQKSLFKESSFCHLRQRFLAMPAVIPPSFCCHLGSHEEEVGEESNTDSQPAEDEDDSIAQ
jgi:hypothetical protein